MTASDATPRLLWTPSAGVVEGAELRRYQRWLATQRGLRFDDYDALWRWSVGEPEAFWASLWDYFEILSHHPYTRVRSDAPMPATRWFEGATLNYAEHVFRRARGDTPAILFADESGASRTLGWDELARRVASLAAHLRALGVGPGDRVVALLPNVPEATVALLAAASIGAVFSSCSPDFGADSVVDRFQQIEPAVLVAADGYRYNGRTYDRREVVRRIADALPTLRQTILLPVLDADLAPFLPGAVLWGETQEANETPLRFEAVPFSHPLWVLYSSGTTGRPKAITHSHGGILLEHLKYLTFHNDVKAGEGYFWYTTTGWMMWNYLQGALLCGASVVLYDGSPGHPNLDVLWKLAADTRLQHFGTSAPYLVACMKAGVAPGARHDLSSLRSISSSGAPLPPEAFDYVYERIRDDVWLVSMSGGTDVCTAFVGGVPTLPVWEGEIQRRALGAAVDVFDEAGQPLRGEVGEMVVTEPMPSMPIYFWNDAGGTRYRESYFEHYPGVWRHGDWLLITERGTLVILGRSDATLNRDGIRIGTAEIYQVLEKLPQVADSLVVNLELAGGRHYMPLFVRLAEGAALDDALRERIRRDLREAYSPRHVPDEIVAVPDVPYTISGKKLEAPVKKILMGTPVEKAANPGVMRNPDSLDFFVAFRDRLRA